MATLPLSKVVDAEDFSSPDLAPYLREIDALTSTRLGRTGGGGSDAVLWEAAMSLRALDSAGAAAPGRRIAGIGAGAGALVFALARRGAMVFAVDRYLEHVTEAPHVAPSGMLDRPDSYVAAPIPRGHVLGVHSSPMRLNLPSDSVDGVFSLGLERLGSLDDVAAAAREMGRILRPGGVAVIATAFRLDGPDDRDSFDPGFVLFTAQSFAESVANPAGLTLRAPISTRQSDATFEARHQFADFVRGEGALQSLAHKSAATSDLVLYHEGFLFCPVIVTLNKDSPAAAVRRKAPAPRQQGRTSQRPIV
jgi:SAM-dependent methyltransferase